MKKIYIAGQVTGLPKDEVVEKFAAMQKQVEALGFIAVNPLTVVGTWEITWEEAMKRCIKALMDCDGMVLLSDWNESSGAKLERQIAEDLCLTICNATKFGLSVLKSNLS